MFRRINYHANLKMNLLAVVSAVKATRWTKFVEEINCIHGELRRM